MNNTLKIYGSDLVEFLESLGCSKRHQIGDHVSMWSVYTGDFFIVPIYDEPLTYVTIKHIIWQLGITDEAFQSMWEEYCKKNKN